LIEALDYHLVFCEQIAWPSNSKDAAPPAAEQIFQRQRLIMGKSCRPRSRSGNKSGAAKR